MAVRMLEVLARPWVRAVGWCMCAPCFKFVPQKGPLKNIIAGAYFRNFTVYQLESRFLEASFFKPRPPDNSNQFGFTKVFRKVASFSVGLSATSVYILSEVISLNDTDLHGTQAIRVRILSGEPQFHVMGS